MSGRLSAQSCPQGPQAVGFLERSRLWTCGQPSLLTTNTVAALFHLLIHFVPPASRPTCRMVEHSSTHSRSLPMNRLGPQNCTNRTDDQISLDEVERIRI
jgi:hypothetical protein